MSVENKQAIRDIICNVIEFDDFGENDRFAEDYGVDSMMILELVSKLEKELHISIPEEYYARMGSFAEVVEVVDEVSK